LLNAIGPVAGYNCDKTASRPTATQPTMPARFAINGLGRIGRALLRVARQRPELELVAINDLGSAMELAPLIRRDSLHGPFAGTVEAEPGILRLDGVPVPAEQADSTDKITWNGTAPDIVVDATGLCKTRDRAAAHLQHGVQRVLVSANATSMDLTICMGVNQDEYDPAAHRLLSGASCTTNCLVPVLHVLDREFGVERAMLNTVHSYNNDQRLLSYPHPDPRRARSATLNMIPTTTSAIDAAVRILPHFKGRLDGFAIRVPTPNVSLLDLVVELESAPSIETVNAAFEGAAQRHLAGILAVTAEPVVSWDLMSDPASAVIDLSLTQQVDDKLYRTVAWYDNEWGHANRLADLIAWIDARSR
jgi:glyceraldehyde 3-phosphate dehydrogenase